MKWLAVFLMTLDHLALYFQGYLPADLVFFCRLIGRLAFPLFAYNVSLGYKRTRSLPRYFARMATFSVLGQLLMEWTAKRTGSFVFCNVLFTFTFALLLLFGYDLITKSIQDTVATMRPVTSGVGAAQKTPPNFGVKVNIKGITLPTRVGIVFGSFLIIISFVAVILLKSDYSYYGLLTVLIFHIANENTEPITSTVAAGEVQRFISMVFRLYLLLNFAYLIINVVFFQHSVYLYIVQSFSVFAVFLFPALARSAKPRVPEKYFFYLYYPIHLSLIMWLTTLV